MRHCPKGTLEENSRYTLNIDLEHVLTVLKPGRLVSAVSFEMLQKYVKTRSQAIERRGQPVSPMAIRKELSSFSSAWSWGLRMGRVSVPFAHKGLRYPKTTEKPPFRSWKEIERQIACGGLTEVQSSQSRVLRNRIPAARMP
uniref:Core-binding (CB) domain-containing protein n=1 Tax=Schlesneria paludicola TaxID=360056 RepID=A0A7C2K2H2_9PLAN